MSLAPVRAPVTIRVRTLMPSSTRAASEKPEGFGRAYHIAHPSDEPAVCYIIVQTVDQCADVGTRGMRAVAACFLALASLIAGCDGQIFIDDTSPAAPPPPPFSTSVATSGQLAAALQNTNIEQIYLSGDRMRNLSRRQRGTDS